jgi:superfamily II DNA/RNA helicase
MLPKNVQVLLFSATFPENVMKYAEKFAPNADQMRLRQQELTVKGISQMYMDCPSEDVKYEILCKLYGIMTIGSSVIFVRVRTTCPRPIGVRAMGMLTYRDRLEKARMRSSAAWRLMATRYRFYTVPMRARVGIWF